MSNTKCDHPTIEKCAKCVAERQGGPCYLRLYGLFDPHYTPYPHHGSEFGDYSRAVTLDGQQQTLVIAMKRGKLNKQTLKLRDDTLGQDIYTQVRTYLADGNMDVLGISVPRRLDERFLATLRRDAELHKKRMLIIDDESLARVVYSVMTRCDLALEEV